MNSIETTCIEQVIARMNLTDPLIKILVAELCRLGFTSIDIEAFINDLLQDEDDESSSAIKSSIQDALAQHDEAKLRAAIEQLTSMYEELWSQIEEWVKKQYADVADELLSAMRKVRLSFTTLYQAQSWANSWYRKRFPHPR